MTLPLANSNYIAATTYDHKEVNMRIARANLATLCAALTLILLLAPTQSQGTTTAKADSSNWWGKNVLRKRGSTVWRISSPTGSESIGWSSGPTDLDDSCYLYGQLQYNPEPKFDVIPGGVKGRFFGGFKHTDGPGRPTGSTARQSGFGGSFVPGVRGASDVAEWWISASGTLGIPGTICTTASYKTSASGGDPWPITSAQLNEMGITGSSYSLFIPLGLDGGSFSPGGDITLHVSYVTAAGVFTLLDIDLNPEQTIVSGDARARFYLLPSRDYIDPNSTLTLGNQVTLTQLQNVLSNDESEGNLINPVYIGVELENIAVPTATLPDGSLAHIDVDTSVTDSASAP